MESRPSLNKKLTGITSALFLCLGASAAFSGNNGANGAANGQPFQYLQNQIDAVEASLDDLNNQFNITLADLESDVANLQSQVDSLTSQMAALQLDADANASEIDALQSSIDELNAELAGKQDILDGSCPEGSSLRVIEPDGGFICEQGGSGSGSGSAALYTLFRASGFETLTRNGQAKQLSISCPSNMHPISGGYTTFSSTNRNSAINVTVNRPDGFGWIVTANNTESSLSTEYVRAVVLCKAY